MDIPVNNRRCCCGRHPNWDIVVGVGGSCNSVLLPSSVTYSWVGEQEAERKRAEDAEAEAERNRAANKVCVCVTGLCLLGVHVCVKGRVGNEVFGRRV